MMSINKRVTYVGICCLALLSTACSIPNSLIPRKEKKLQPTSFNSSLDSTNSARANWKDFFKDPYLHVLIDTALRNNQELNIMIQEINIAQQEVRARKGQYLPFVGGGAQAGIEKAPRFTRSGAVDENIEIEPGKQIPNPLADYFLGANVSWEIDIWKKLRNSKKAAVYRYLSTTAGKNFMVTNLIAEIATTYYELMALDNQLEILKRNIEIQQNALLIVRMEKQAAKVTELAVRRFEAEVLKNQSRQFYIKQSITETENKINFLAGRFPQAVLRNSQAFAGLVPDSVRAGVPSQLLENRPDVKQAELDLMAAKLDVTVAKAYFYPSLNITGAIGLQAFNPTYLVTKPESMMYYLSAGIMAPLINRNAIKATYYSANARQIQAVFNYEMIILTAYIDVANQLSNINNLRSSYELQTKQVEALTQSIDISTRLFRSARADYMEVLLTQRDALQSKFELVETKMQQMHARVYMYKALGGGWK